MFLYLERLAEEKADRIKQEEQKLEMEAKSGKPSIGGYTTPKQGQFNILDKPINIDDLLG